MQVARKAGLQWITVYCQICAICCHQCVFVSGSCAPHWTGSPQPTCWLSFLVEGIAGNKAFPWGFKDSLSPCHRSLLTGSFQIPRRFHPRLLHALGSLQSGIITFLCSSELTVPSLLPFSSGVYLSLTDITIDSCESPTCVCFHLTMSKTDHYRKGCFMHIGKGLNPLCTIQTLLAYLTITGTRKAPFFSFVTSFLSGTYNGYVRCWGWLAFQVSFPASAFAPGSNNGSSYWCSRPPHPDPRSLDQQGISIALFTVNFAHLHYNKL